MKFLKRLWSHFGWLWNHWGWGWHGRSLGKLRRQRISGDRQALKAYCREYGLTRKAAKKGFRQAKMNRKNYIQMRKAERDARKAGREPVFRTVEKPRH